MPKAPRTDIRDDPTVKGALGRLEMIKPNASTLVIHTSAETDLSPEEIWKVWSDLERWPTWCKPLVSSTRWLEKRDWEVGAKFEQTLHLGFPNGKKVSVETVREVNENQSVTWWKNEAGVKSCHIWFFMPLQNGGTRVYNTEIQVGYQVLLYKIFVKGGWTSAFQQCVDNLIKTAQREHNQAPAGQAQ